MISAETQRAVEAALQRDDFDAAGRLAEHALDRGEQDAMLYLFAGVRRRHGGDTRGAVALLREAVRLDPENPGVLMTAGDALRFTGELAEAVRMFDHALAGDPMQVAAWYGRAQALDSSGRIDDAMESYARVAELAPETAPGHAGMAAMLAQLGRNTEARASAMRALALSPRDPGSLIALARCDLANNQAAAAVARLEALTARQDLVAHDRVVALSLLGDAHDAAGDTDAAFAAYTAANARFAEVHAGPNAPPAHLHFVEAIDAAVTSVDPVCFAGPAPTVPGQAASHIFLLGYPRSGTTLVEQILAAAPRVATLEEEPTLGATGDRYLNPAGIAALGDIDADQAAALRSGYWQAVRAAGVEPIGQTFIDMDPLKSVALPLIARLFPDSKVILVRRDPRDVVWSCFRRSFVYSAATYEFSSLKRAAWHYDAVMRLAEHCLERLPLTVHTLRYRDIVHDFDAETQRLCDFAGLPWSEALRRFDRSAMARPVKTRSAAQVRTGLYDGTGQWRRYAEQMEPVLPMLEPWVRKFGFEV